LNIEHHHLPEPDIRQNHFGDLLEPTATYENLYWCMLPIYYDWDITYEYPVTQDENGNWTF